MTFSAATWRGHASDVPFEWCISGCAVNFGGFRVGGSENPGDSHQGLIFLAGPTRRE